MARVHDDANASQPVVVISGKVLTLCDQLSWTHNQLLVLCHIRAAVIDTTGKTAVIQRAAANLVQNPFDPQTSGPQLPVSLDK